MGLEPAQGEKSATQREVFTPLGCHCSLNMEEKHSLHLEAPVGTTRGQMEAASNQQWIKTSVFREG